MNRETVNSYIDDIAKRLHNPTQYGSATVMVGAGFSKNAVRLDDKVTSPSWEELASLMYSELYPKLDSQDNKGKWEENRLKKTAGKNVLKLAEEYKTMFKRNKLDQFIEQSIDDDKYIPGELHKMLLELNWRDVFTTNYDTLLERTIDKISVRRNYKVLTAQSDLPGSTNPRIVKLHGSINSSKPYIICEEDYRTYPVKHAPFVNTVQQAMLETQLCLIGFSGDDPNFINWVGWLRDNMGENCPQIYLCGVFSSMSEPEKKTLEAQNITIVDLSELFTDVKPISHFDALRLFFEKLRDFGKEKKELLENFPYPNIEFEKDIDRIMDDTYFEKMTSYTGTLRETTSNYILLPFHHRYDYLIDNLQSHLINILRIEHCHKQIVLLGNIIYLLRRLYVVLDDVKANLIIKLLIKIDIENSLSDSTLINAISELVIYLLEMYRIDGEWNSYDQIMSKVNQVYSKLEVKIRTQIDIESAKYFIAKFEYNKALDSINRIGEESPIEVRIRKACLLIQLSNRSEALDILKKSSADLAQKTYSEDKTASLLSYMNLCARALNDRTALTKFSDSEFATNQYNLRKIINDLKDEVASYLLLSSKRSENIISSFNPGTYKITYGTTPKEKQKALSTSLRYVMFQDYLVLPVFSDHKEIYALSLMEIIDTSTCPLWKWSSILRIKDKNILDTFFSRDRLFSSEKIWSETLFDLLVNLVQSFNQSENFFFHERIITRPLIINLLSRLCIFLDDERIIILVNELIAILEQSNVDLDKELRGVFDRIQYSFNSNILEHFIMQIINTTNIPSWVSSSFTDLKLISSDKYATAETIKNVCHQINSLDVRERDNGVAKAILINDYFGFNNHSKEVADSIWNRTDQNGFPVSRMYTLLLWEDLPHPFSVNFTELYLNYLTNTQFTLCVDANTNKGSGDIDNIIHVYLSCFIKMSFFAKKDITNVPFQASFFTSILVSIYSYLGKEKEILSLKFDIFGEAIEGRKRFNKLADFVAIIVTQAYLQNQYDIEIDTIVNRIRTLLTENCIPVHSINTIKSVILGEFKKSNFENLMNLFIIGENEVVTQASVSIDLLLVYYQKNDTDSWIVEEVIDLIRSFRYMDVRRSRIALSNSLRFIDRKALLDLKSQIIITKSFSDCYYKLNIEQTEVNKDTLDAMYILSIVVKKYYRALINQGQTCCNCLLELIDNLKSSELREVKFMWEGY